MQEKLLSILTNAFGPGKQTTKDNYIFYCPVCQHRKPKLEIGVATHKWHCWVCNKGGLSLYSLLKWSRVNSKYLDELSQLVGKLKRPVSIKEKEQVSDCVLPKEYKPLWEPIDSYFWRAAMRYLAGRGLTPMDIIKYHIGYCDAGEYENMLVIPSYSSTGQLTYFVTRAFLETGPKFKNPPVPKNVIGFESTINWSEPVILVESALDAMTIRRNAIPLFGKSIPDMLRDRILHERVDTVYLCLDADAVSDAINHVQFFLDNGIGVYMTTIPEGHDPNSMGHEKIWQCIEKSEFVDSEKLFKLRVGDHLYGGGKTNLPHRRRSRSTTSATSRVSGSFR